MMISHYCISRTRTLCYFYKKYVLNRLTKKHISKHLLITCRLYNSNGYNNQQLEKNPNFKLENVIRQKLINLSNENELLHIIEENETKLTAENAYNVLSLIYSINTECFHVYKWSDKEKHRCIRSVCEKMINILDRDANLLPNLMLTNIFKYMKRLNYSLDQPNLIAECENQITSFSLETINDIASNLETKNLQNLNFQVKILNLLNDCLDKCEMNSADLQYIMSCFSYLTVLGRGTKEKIIFVIKKFLENNKLENFQSALNCLKILTLPPYISNCKSLTESLSDNLQNYIINIDHNQLVELHNISFLQNIFDSFRFRQSVSSRALILLDSLNSTDQLKLLPCLTKNDILKISDRVLSIIENSHQNMCFICHSRAFVKIMCKLQMMHAPLLEQFWNNVCNHFGEDNFEFFMCKLYAKFKLLCYGKYTHQKFEDSLKEILIKKLQNSYLRPKKVSLICQFFIILNRTNSSLIPNIVIDQLHLLIHNFDIDDLHNVSESIRIIQPLWINNEMFLNQMKRISDQITNEAFCRTNEVSSFKDACSLSSIVLLHKKNKNEIDINNVMQQHLHFACEMTSKTIYSVCNSIASISYYNPDLLEQATKYILNNKVSGWAASAVLFACYRIGYHPNIDNLHLEKFIEIIDKDSNDLVGLRILHSALALSLFHYLPFSWIHNIFSVPFLDRLDKDIKGSKTPSYPKQVKQHLLELNRIACLEYPELNIPWFHKKEENSIEFTDNTRSYQKFHKDVEESLCFLLGSRQFFAEHVVTPYWYHLSFECIVDPLENVIHHPVQKNALLNWPDVQQTFSSIPEGCQRIAINVLSDKAFCFNVRKLIGSQQLKHRHLEILEYKVVNIPFYEWFSLSLSDRKSRCHYLEKKIFT